MPEAKQLVKAAVAVVNDDCVGCSDRVPPANPFPAPPVSIPFRIDDLVVPAYQPGVYTTYTCTLRYRENGVVILEFERITTRESYYRGLLQVMKYNPKITSENRASIERCFKYLKPETGTTILVHVMC